MSVSYVTRRPMTLVEAEGFLAPIGWVPTEASNGGAAVSNGKNYAHDWAEQTCKDGKIHVVFTKYGPNNLREVCDMLGVWSEHDNAYGAL